MANELDFEWNKLRISDDEEDEIPIAHDLFEQIIECYWMTLRP